MRPTATQQLCQGQPGAQGHKPDYMYLLQRMMMDNPEAAVSLAKMVARQPGPPIDLNTMADLFLQRSMVREATAFLLDVLTDNKPEHDRLQTKVLVLAAPCASGPDLPLHGCAAIILWAQRAWQ